MWRAILKAVGSVKTDTVGKVACAGMGVAVSYCITDFLSKGNKKAEVELPKDILDC